ncbi:MAG: GTP-binding protein [Mariniphaga sp.]
MEKIPVHIISGFLGAGKTTAILKLLNNKRADEQWAVIINEFGKISIDTQTLRSSSDAGTVFDISGGCICCSAKGYFQENLAEIISTGNYSRVIIEPSGLGGIEMVTEIVRASPALHLMPVICLVDINYIDNARLQLLPIYRRQIEKADLIAFSKCDLLKDFEEQTHLIEKFKAIFPQKEKYLQIANADFWLSLPNTERSAIAEENKFRIIPADEPDLKDINYQSNNYTFSEELIFNADQLALLFTKYTAIIRAKGHIRTENGWKLLNFTLSNCIFEPCPAKEQNELIVISEKSKSLQIDRLGDEIKITIITKATSDEKTYDQPLSAWERSSSQ